MDLHFEGNRLYYMEKEAELFRALDHLSKYLSSKQDITDEQLWEVFHICADSANVYRHITDYFNVLDRQIFKAKTEVSQYKQELYDYKKENSRLQKIVDEYIDGL